MLGLRLLVRWLELHQTADGKYPEATYGIMLGQKQLGHGVFQYRPGETLTSSNTTILGNGNQSTSSDDSPNSLGNTTVTEQNVSPQDLNATFGRQVTLDINFYQPLGRQLTVPAKFYLILMTFIIGCAQRDSSSSFAGYKTYTAISDLTIDIQPLSPPVAPEEGALKMSMVIAALAKLAETIPTLPADQKYQPFSAIIKFTDFSVGTMKMYHGREEPASPGMERTGNHIGQVQTS